MNAKCFVDTIILMYAHDRSAGLKHKHARTLLEGLWNSGSPHETSLGFNCLIATFCLRHGHSLLHRGRDFDHFEQILGLAVMHP